MSYINVGAFISGKRAQTKQALVQALKNAPETVRFDRVPNLEGKPDIPGDDLPEGDVLSVALPDPWTCRRRFALVLKCGRGVRVQ